MNEEDRIDDRDFVAELLQELFDGGNLNHLDGYGGALFALDLLDAVESLHKKGWRMTKEKDGE